MSSQALLKRFDIVADQSANIPSIRRLVIDLAVRGKLLGTEELDVDVQEMLRRISSRTDELALSGAIKKLKPLSKIDNDEVPAAYLAHCTFARLGNIANLQKGLTGIQSSMSGEFPLVVTAAERGTCDHFDFDGAAAIIPLVSSTGHGNASINRLHYQEGKFALGTILCAVFPFDEQLVSARFLYEYLTVFKEELLVSKMIGTANVTLTLGKIAEVPVPIIAPAVQRRVDELMALCDQLEAAQQERERRRDRLAAASLQRLNRPAADTTPEAQREHARFHLHHLPRLTTRPEHIKAMRQTILNLAVRGQFVPQDAGEASATNLLSSISAAKSSLMKAGAIRNVAGLSPLSPEDAVFQVPEGWVWERLGTVGYTQTGTTPPTSMPECFGGKTPFISPSDLTASVTTYDGKGLTEIGVKHSRLIAKNSVLMVCIGSTIGKVNVVDREVCCNQQINTLTPVVDGMTGYLAIALRSDYFQEVVIANAGMGTLPILSKGKWEQLPVPIPPLTEQHRIVAKVDSLMALCDQLEAQLTTTQTDSRRLLEAVLQQALTPVH